MAEKISLTTGDLYAQAARIGSVAGQMREEAALCESSLDLMSSACSVFTVAGVMFGASSLKRELSSLASDISAAGQLAKMAAEAFERTDSEVASQISAFIGNDVTVSDQVNDYSDVPAPDVPPVLDDFDAYNDTAVDAEYARLSGWWEHVCDKKDPVGEFMKELQNLPENDPMRYITRDQVRYLNSFDGFSAIVIDDGNGSAMVIFAGTNPDQFLDLVADGALTVGVLSTQELQAKLLIHELAKEYDDITVTGHSLGGYLATSAALSEDKVSRCIAFEPPGRYDVANQALFNGKNCDKITTYEAKGSVISSVGVGVGNVIDVDVAPSGSWISKNHSIENLGDALGGDAAIANSWANGRRYENTVPESPYAQGGGSW